MLAPSPITSANLPSPHPRENFGFGNQMFNQTAFQLSPTRHERAPDYAMQNGNGIHPEVYNPAWLTNPFWNTTQPPYQSYDPHMTANGIHPDPALRLDIPQLQPKDYGFIPNGGSDQSQRTSSSSAFFGYSGPSIPNTATTATSINPAFLQQQGSPSSSRKTAYPRQVIQVADLALDTSADYPGSPLLQLSPSAFGDFSSEDDDDLRVRSLKHESDSSTSHKGESNAKSARHKRKIIWNGDSDEGPNVSHAQKERELEQLAILEAGGSGTRRERRRLQNRLAQRAFRARSKVQNQEFFNHMQDLKDTVRDQDQEIIQLSSHVSQLQKENTALKAEDWAQMNAFRANGQNGQSLQQ